MKATVICSQAASWSTVNEAFGLSSTCTVTLAVSAHPAVAFWMLAAKDAV